MHHNESINISTRGRGTYEITAEVQRIVARSGVAEGLCTVFIHHTSASLILCENADPSVRRDLETFMSRLVRDGDRAYTHTTEGQDDMPSHIRSVLTQSSIGMPVRGGRADLGTWQGVYVWEHRAPPHTRRVTVSVTG